jgi:hypothetical protein
MLKRRFLTIASFTLALCLLQAAGAAQASVADADSRRSGVEQSEEYCESLVGVINWQLDRNAEYRLQRDKFKETGDPGDEPPDTYDEVAAKYAELESVFLGIAELKAAADELQPDFGDYVPSINEALKHYYGMVYNAAVDLDAVFAYFFAMRDAILPMKEFNADESAYADYKAYADALSAAIAEAQANLKSVTYPAYMSDSHKTFARRIDEFQSFSQDFSYAIQIQDPLRVASCNNRLQRLTIMFNKADDAMTDDFALQFTRVAERLNGAVAELRRELLSYM